MANIYLKNVNFFAKLKIFCIIQTMYLEEKIEELLYVKADDFEISKVIKEHIGHYLNSLDEYFVKNQGKDFLVKHTKTIDNFINIIYKYLLRKYFGNYMPFSNSIPLVLVGMGSYGREELCVYSDIDIMIVYKDIKGYNIEPIIEDIFTLAWDAGMKLGHRSHRVSELVEVSSIDITIKTALLESRFLCGSKILWIESEREIEKIRNLNKKQSVLDILEIYHKRVKENPINMEPNIKESQGGLRDANTLFWLCKIIYGITKLKDLSTFLLDEDEFREFRHALEFLYKARSATHLSARKKQDILNLEYIPDVAKKLGFEDKVLKNAQMQLSHKILQSMNTMKITCNIFIKKATASLLADTSQFTLLKNARVAPQLYILNDTVYATFRKKEISLYDVLGQLKYLYRDKIKFDISYLNLIRNCKIPTHNSRKIYQAFKNLFYQEFIYETLKTLDDASLLQHLCKPFAKVKFLAQFDGYHKYPVDKHTLISLYHLQTIQDDFIKSLFDSLSPQQKAMLRLVLFLHDIGKGRRGDHSEIGARVFKAYAQKLGFSAQSIQYGVILIKNHTQMNNIANRENIYNEKVVLSFVLKLQNRQILDMLYIITYADINGVCEKTYSSFTSKLLKDLYSLSLKAFETPLLIDETSRRLRREKLLRKNEEFKKLHPHLQRKILSISSSFFFLKYTSQEITEIAKLADSTKTYKYSIKTSPYLTIEVMRFKNFNVGYLLGKLGYLNLVNMEIYELFDGKKQFKFEFNEDIDKDIVPHISSLIEDSFDMSKKSNLIKPNILRDEITLDYEHSLSYADMSIKTTNQKGLMAYVMSRFDEKNIDISMAKIQTIKGKTRNLFLIEKTLYLYENREKILNLFITES